MIVLAACAVVVLAGIGLFGALRIDPWGATPEVQNQAPPSVAVKNQVPRKVAVENQVANGSSASGFGAAPVRITLVSRSTSSPDLDAVPTIDVVPQPSTSPP